MMAETTIYVTICINCGRLWGKEGGHRRFDGTMSCKREDVEKWYKQIEEMVRLGEPGIVNQSTNPPSKNTNNR